MSAAAAAAPREEDQGCAALGDGTPVGVDNDAEGPELGVGVGVGATHACDVVEDVLVDVLGRGAVISSRHGVDVVDDDGQAARVGDL